MKKNTNKKGKTSDEYETTSTEEKPLYQAPVVMPLGALARGWGVCELGPTPNPGHGQCTNGTNVQGHTGCQLGSGR